MNGIVDQPAPTTTTEQKQAKRDIARSIKYKFDRLQPFSPESCIYRVHKGLRKFNPRAYTPVLVSIGPYHQNSKQYSAIKKYKLWYSRSLLRDSKDIIEKCISKLKNLEEEARKYYAEPIGLNSDQFVELMLLDGCFVVGYICSKTTKPSERDDPILDVDWMDFQICRDMMLLENQLPYFVLSELYKMTKDPTQMRSFLERAIWVCATSLLPKPRSVKKLCGRISDDRDIKHLLHLVHLISSPSKPMSSGRNTRNSEGGRVLDRMRSVEELKEFGVRFKKVGDVDKSSNGGSDDISILDVEFSKGLMRVPCFRFEDSTETFFRNLIAYEQHSSDKNVLKNFTDFAFFIDQLVNSETDVNLLRHEGIIVNLGDEKEVASIFNTLCAGVIFPRTSQFCKAIEDVNDHCKRGWNKTMALFRHNYFNSPWTGISTCAAGVLLILTLLQTISAFVQLKSSGSSG